MIGGIDTYIPTQAGKVAMEVAVRAIRQYWPLAVFENGNTGDRYPSFSEIPFGDLEEIFVYRDAKSADGWDAEGAIPGLLNTMVHVVDDDEGLTVVVDEKDDLMKELLKTIISGLRDEILNLNVLREAA
jgi:hypothetical protein